MEIAEAFEARTQVMFLDVREWYEWDAGRIEGSLHVPLRTLPERLDELTAERPIVVVCQIGQRSALAADLLRRRGMDAHNLEGGIEAWVEAGYPIVDSLDDRGTIAEGWAQQFPRP